MSSTPPKPSQYIDISTFPPDEKAHIVDWARKYNNLCVDVDGISGATPQEKQEFHGLMGIVRRVFQFCHGKRFHFLVFFATVHYGLGALKQFGITPDQASRLVEAMVKIAEKMANG